jgi:hypothetical protein
MRRVALATTELNHTWHAPLPSAQAIVGLIPWQALLFIWVSLSICLWWFGWTQKHKEHRENARFILVWAIGALRPTADDPSLLHLDLSQPCRNPPSYPNFGLGSNHLTVMFIALTVGSVTYCGVHKHWCIGLWSVRDQVLTFVTLEHNSPVLVYTNTVVDIS